MPLYDRDDATARLVGELAKLRGVSKQDAIRIAAAAELGRIAEACRCGSVSPGSAPRIRRRP